MVSPKRYYTFMLEQELIDALKDAKEQTHLSEGAQIRQALREWFSKQGIAIKKKADRKRAGTRKRP
jgi:hypothetical protein